MGIYIKNEAGGQWHGQRKLFESREGTNHATAVQETVTCYVLEEFANDSKINSWEKLKDATFTKAGEGLAAIFTDSWFRQAGVDPGEEKPLIEDDKWWKSWFYQMEDWRSWNKSNKKYKFFHHDTWEKDLKTIPGLIHLIASKAHIKKDLFQKADIYAVEDGCEAKVVDMLKGVSVDPASLPDLKAPSQEGEEFQEIEGDPTTAMTSSAVLTRAAGVFSQLFTDRVVVGISLKMLNKPGEVVEYNAEGVERPEDVSGQNPNITNVGKILHPDFKKKPLSSTSINFVIHDEEPPMEADGKPKKIKRALKLDIRGGSFKKNIVICGLNHQSGKSTDEEGNAVSVPNAQIGNATTFMQQFNKSGRGQLAAGSLKEALDAFKKTQLPKFCDDASLLNLDDVEETISKAEAQLNLPAAMQDDFAHWYVVTTKILNFYLAVDNAVKLVMERHELKDYKDGLESFMLLSYYAGKGVNAEFSVCMACPYLLLG